MDIKDRLEKLKAGIDKSVPLSLSDKSLISNYYERITGKIFNRTSCGQCYRDAFIEMYIFYKKNGLKVMQKYIMKRGPVIHFKGNVYTRVNITDDLSIEILRDAPARIKFFESFPEDWEEEINNLELKDPEPAEDPEKSEPAKLELKQPDDPEPAEDPKETKKVKKIFEPEDK